MSKDIFRFRVGQRDLTFIKIMKDNQQIVDTVCYLAPKSKAILMAQAAYKGTIVFADIYEAKHVCLLLNIDLFEYSNKGWERHRDVGRDGNYDQDSLGNALNGTTYVSPDRLAQAIENRGKWSGNQYDFLKHNCQDFVQFCMRALGCPESMIMKKGPCYRSQEKRKLK